jgi:3-hydroxyisobutyrate dehydrogenase
MNIGWIGTGLMGGPMAQRILDAAMPLTVYNRTPSKVAELQAAGAQVAASPAIALHNSTLIVLMLSDAAAIRSALFADAARVELAGKTILQMGTIAPTESQAIQAEVVAAGGEYLEAPVLGSIPEARSGKLIVMVGGTPAQFAQWLPVLQCFGPEPTLIGPVGAAAAVKLALNQLIGVLTAGFATSLSFLLQQGIEPEPFMQILRSSALYAPTFDKKLSRMLDQDYSQPNFPTKHLLKDMKLFATAADAIGVNAAVPVAVQQILDRALALGLAETDYSALFAAIVPAPDPS